MIKMKNKIAVLILSAAMFISGRGMENEENKNYLFKKRTESVQNLIDERYKKISEKPVTENNKTTWGLFNGQTEYCICNANELLLLKEMILDNKNQKEFWVMDVGAGGFQWCRSVMAYIEEDHEISKIDDLHVHILGVRGEVNQCEAITKRKKSTRYELGGFKIENIQDELLAHLQYKSLPQFDIIVSAATLMHLSEPVGTLEQLSNLIRPSGFLFAWGFGVNCVERDLTSIDDYEDIFLDLCCSFSKYMKILIRKSDHSPAVVEFIFRRTSDEFISMPFSFDMENQSESPCYLMENQTESTWKEFSTQSLSHYGLNGDKELYEYFLKKGIFGVTQRYLSRENDFRLHISKHPALSYNGPIFEEDKK